MVRPDDRQKHLEPRLDDAFSYAASAREKVEATKKSIRAQPLEAARWALEGVPGMMQVLRTQAAELYGVDIASPEEALKAFKVRDYLGTWDFLHKVNMYSVYKECRRKLLQCTSEASLSRDEMAAKVCDVLIETEQAVDEVWLHMLNEQRVFAASRGSEEAMRIAKNEEARRMAAHIATRTSLRKNRLLAKALDEIREYNESASREQFRALLNELYVEAPQVWDEQRGVDQRLLATRSAVAKKIAGQSREKPPTALELATFAEREALLKRAREAGLTPREQELLQLAMRNPERFLRNGKLNHKEAARELGVAVGTTKSLWSRIKKTLAA